MVMVMVMCVRYDVLSKVRILVCVRVRIHVRTKKIMYNVSTAEYKRAAQ